VADYVTPEKVAMFAQEFDGLDPSGQALIITAASRLFDNLADVEADTFKQAAGESDRVVYGNGTAWLRIPPYVGPLGVDPVVILDDEDVEMELPEYFEKDGYLVIRGYGQGVPTRDRADAILVQTFEGWPINKEITVSANWGFETVPFDIQFAVIQLAIHLWRTGDPAFTSMSQSGEPFTAPAIPAQVTEIAERYRMKYHEKAYFA
jgi:hypothetical protein